MKILYNIRTTETKINIKTSKNANAKSYGSIGHYVLQVNQPPLLQNVENL